MFFENALFTNTMDTSIQYLNIEISSCLISIYAHNANKLMTGNNVIICQTFKCSWVCFTEIYHCNNFMILMLILTVWL